MSSCDFAPRAVKILVLLFDYNLDFGLGVRHYPAVPYPCHFLDCESIDVQSR